MAYRPWHDKKTSKTMLKPIDDKCLHFYFIDPVLGLCCLRAPTWCPFRLQFYCNGHALLAGRLRKAHIKFTLMDNAFFVVENTAKANALTADIRIKRLHRLLDQYAEHFCPVLKTFQVKPHWSIMQVSNMQPTSSFDARKTSSVFIFCLLRPSFTPSNRRISPPFSAISSTAITRLR